MKKILFISFTTFVVTVFASNTYAQQSNSFFVSGHSPLTGVGVKSFIPEAERSSFAGIPLSEISIKAVRDFTHSFKRAENVHWYKVPDGLMAYFTEDGKKTRASYDKKGNWLYNMRSYAEEYLPKEIRAQVKSVYYDYTITWVKEITKGQQTTYVVYIQDKTSYKMIKVCEGEMEIAEEFTEI